jgi:Protein of unknown function (DUF2934)
MKTNLQTQPEVPATPIPVISKLALAPATLETNNDVVTEAQIQDLAYKLYEQRGRVDGNDQQDWFEAESILREPGKPAA